MGGDEGDSVGMGRGAEGDAVGNCVSLLGLQCFNLSLINYY